MNPYTKGFLKCRKNGKNVILISLDCFKHQDKIRRVTLWGVTDNQSWKNDFPVKGRTDYPLFLTGKTRKTYSTENNKAGREKLKSIEFLLNEKIKIFIPGRLYGRSFRSCF
jgi:GH35 family endo-1,4-beta-xylanase